MNSSEKRRKELLKQTRSMYTDRQVPPAIHPRFGNLYGELYGESEAPTNSTFALRMVLCMLLFALFVTMDYRGVEIASVSSDQIIEVVEHYTDITELIPIQGG